MANAIPAIYENGVLRPLAPVNFSESQTVWLQVLPEETMTELQPLLGSLYESGLLTPPTSSNAPPISDADLVVMVESIHVAGQPLSDTIIEDRGDW